MSTSIILPNYNHAKYLPRSLNAIFSQNIKPFEVIVIDDKSTDNSLEVLKKYESKHSNLNVIKNSENKGTAKSVNIGIEKACGKYLAFCAADDLLNVNFIETLEKYLEANPKIAICTSDFCTFIDNDLKNLHKNSLLISKQSTVIYPKELVNAIQKQLFWIPTNTSLYRRKYLEKFIGLDGNLKWMSDWFLNYQIAFQYPVAYLSKELSVFRILSNSYSHKIENKNIAFDNLFNVLKGKPKHFQTFFKESGVLYQQGKKAFNYILRYPKKWSYLPPMLKNFINLKLKKY